MSTCTVRVGLGYLPPELISVVAAQLPWHNRAPTLLSLALTSHYLCNVVIPRILFTHVRLVGEDDNFPVLKGFLRAMTTTHISNDTNQSRTMLPSQYIQHLCIHGNLSDVNSDDDDDDDQPELPLLELQIQRLVDCGGLSNLVSLTIHREYRSHVPLPLPNGFWNSIRNHCPNFQGVHASLVHDWDNAEWIPSIQGMKSVRLEGMVGGYKYGALGAFKFDFSKFPVNLHTLELGLAGSPGGYINASGLLSMLMPDLHVLILDWVDVVDPSMTKEFWKKHPRLKRLELGWTARGEWFNGFETGMLPNLTILKSDFMSARILLPHISESLISLCLWGTYNAQAPYLLRTVPKCGILPALRSLGIQQESIISPRAYDEEHHWREDENGTVTGAPLRNEARKFDGNYIMSIAKAAPNLEELELMGTSDDTIDSITSALCDLPKLSRLTLSGPINLRNKPFFESCGIWMEYDESSYPVPAQALVKSAYAPLSFFEAVCDLARGCPTLEIVTIGDSRTGELRIEDGVSGRILREGIKLEVRRIRAWGRSIGIEEEW